MRVLLWWFFHSVCIVCFVLLCCCCLQGWNGQSCISLYVSGSSDLVSEVDVTMSHDRLVIVCGCECVCPAW